MTANWLAASDSVAIRNSHEERISSAVTGVPLAVVAMASMGFVLGDLIKALVASLAVSGLAKLF